MSLYFPLDVDLVFRATNFRPWLRAAYLYLHLWVRRPSAPAAEIRLDNPYLPAPCTPTITIMPPEAPIEPFVQPGQPLNDFLRSFWQRQVDAAEQETPDYRHPALPLARIKKVMKSDPDVKVSWLAVEGGGRGERREGNS